MKEKIKKLKEEEVTKIPKLMASIEKERKKAKETAEHMSNLEPKAVEEFMTAIEGDTEEDKDLEEAPKDKDVSNKKARRRESEDHMERDQENKKEIKRGQRRKRPRRRGQRVQV